MSASDNEQPGRPAPEIDASLIPLSTVRTPVNFAQCLDQLRMLAGPLSHREIESRSGGRLRRTKIGQVLGGELPRREFLTAYLEVCGVSGAASEPWHRVWARLISTTPNLRQLARTAEDGDALVLKKERDEALGHVQRLTEELETLRSITHAADGGLRTQRSVDQMADGGLQMQMSTARAAEAGLAAVTRDREFGGSDKPVMDELQTLRAERDAADRRARRLGELNESTVIRLRTAEATRDQALEHVRRLSRELEAAQARIAELSNATARQRIEQTGGETDLQPAMDEIVRPRGRQVDPGTGVGDMRPTRYIQDYTQEQADELYGPGTGAPTPVLGEE